MSTTNTPSKPSRRRPGRPRKQQHPQASVTPPSAPDQACPSTATQLSDVPPQRTTEPVNTPYPQIYPNYPFSFYTDVSGSGDPFTDSNTGPGFDYTGDLENTNLDLTQGFPALGLSTALRSLSSALETTPIDPQLSAVDTQFSTSTETAASQPQTNPTTDAALSSTSQATTQEHRQPTIEEEVLALSAAIVGESSQSATPAQPTTVPEGPSEQAHPATSKRAQKAPPKQPRKRKADQVDGQSTSGPATKKQATESAKEKSNEAPKEPPKNPRKRKADQVDGQSAPATAAKKTATEKSKEASKEQSKETSEEQSQDTSKEQSQADSSDNPEPQFRASFKEDRSNRLSRWAHSFAETVAKNQFDALDYLEIFQPDTVAQQAASQEAASQEAASQQSAEGQPAVDQPAGDKPTGKKPAGKKSVGKKSARNQSAESPAGNQPAENQPAENQPAGEPATNMQANEQTQGVPNPNEQPVDPAIKSPGHYAEKEARRCIKVGGINFQRAGLGLPHGLGAEENNRRVSFLEAELKLQKGRAPVLPPSQLAQPDPKPFTPKAYQVPDNVTDTRVLEFFRKKNIDLCTKNKQVDLERNNQAAKGTRSRREEALDAHRELANNMAVELNWWRLKAIANGADFREWDVVPPTVKQCMLNEMNERVKKLEEAAAKTAKKNKSAAHSARTKKNSRLSKEDEARKKLEVQEVIAAFAAKDWAAIKKMSDPEYKAKPPRAPRNTAASRRNRASVTDEDTETSTAANTGVTTTMATDDMPPGTAPSDDMATGNMPSNNMPVDNAEFGGTEFGGMDFDNPSYNMPTNMPEMPSTDMTSDNTLGFGNVSSFNTSVAPTQFNAVPDPMYGGVPVEHPTYINPQNNAFGSVYTQQQQPSDLPQGTGDCHKLRRQPSNVTMLDAQSDPFQSIDPNMGGTMNQTLPYWETPNAPPSHGSLPPNIDPSLLGTIGNESTLPPNNMSHNIHGPLGDPSLLLPNDIGQSSEGLANSVPWYSEEEALVRAFLPSLSRNTNQNTSTTNDKKTTDQVDTNASTSSKYPDPDEDFNFSRYINFSP